MRGWMNPWKRNSSLMAASALMLLLTACGGNPPPLPPPPPSGFGGSGGLLGTACIQASGAAPLNPQNVAYSGNMVSQQGGSTSSSISTNLFYQTAPVASQSIQNIVGTANLVLPQLSAANPYAQNTQQNRYCVSTTDAAGTVTPGRLAVGVGAVQLVMTGTIPISTSQYSGYGGYGGYGGGYGYPTYGYPGYPQNTTGTTDRLEVRIGYQCDAWITSDNRINGCVEVLTQYLGVYLSLYAQ